MTAGLEAPLGARSAAAPWRARGVGVLFFFFLFSSSQWCCINSEDIWVQGERDIFN